MSKAMEGMVKTLMGAMGVDPEAIKVVVTERVEQFEANIKMLNETLVFIMETQKRIERNQHLMANAFNNASSGIAISGMTLEPIPTANGANNAATSNV